MARQRADNRGPGPAFPPPEGTPAVGAASQTGAEPAIEIACPVCATFNPSAFRFCPQCGHLLGVPHRRERPAARASHQRLFFRPLVCLLWLVVVVEAGLLIWLWETRPPGLSVPGSAAGLGHNARPGSDAASAGRAAREAPVVTAAGRPRQAERVEPQTSRQPDSAAVELTLFDREGDVLRHVRGTLSYQERRVVTTFASILGAYGATIRFAGATTLPIRAVEHADAEENVAVLALDASHATSPVPPLTLEALARTTYEETLAQQRYLAEKRARAYRWEEAIAHWKRVIELAPSLQQAPAAALAEAWLQASAVAQTEGRRADAYALLRDAVAWLPERADLRLPLAQSLFARAEYSEAINQYATALTLLPSQAADITSAIVRVYQAWGQGLMRQGQFLEAASRFRAALQLDSTSGELYVALGQAELRRRAIDAAIEAFEAALTYAPGLRSEIDPYLAKAQALQEGPQTVVVDFPPGSTRIEVLVRLDGRLEVPCIVDTGATVTLMPMWAAAALGYQLQAPSAWVNVQTAGGARRLPSASINRIAIQGLDVANLPVVFGDLPGDDGSKGLLGMDFLRYFALGVDHEIGRMTLRAQ